MTNFDKFIYNTYLDILIKRLPDSHPTGEFPKENEDTLPILSPIL